MEFPHRRYLLSTARPITPLLLIRFESLHIFFCICILFGVSFLGKNFVVATLCACALKRLASRCGYLIWEPPEKFSYTERQKRII